MPTSRPGRPSAFITTTVHEPFRGFQMSVRAHSKVQPEIAGYYFLPTYIKVEANTPMNGLDFTGTAIGWPFGLIMTTRLL